MINVVVLHTLNPDDILHNKLTWNDIWYQPGSDVHAERVCVPLRLELHVFRTHQPSLLCHPECADQRWYSCGSKSALQPGTADLALRLSGSRLETLTVQVQPCNQTCQLKFLS